jgi:hypothetical protein
VESGQGGISRHVANIFVNFPELGHLRREFQMPTDEFNEKFAKTVSIVWTTFIVILVFAGLIYGAFSFGVLVGRTEQDMKDHPTRQN